MLGLAAAGLGGVVAAGLLRLVWGLWALLPIACLGFVAGVDLRRPLLPEEAPGGSAELAKLDR